MTRVGVVSFWHETNEYSARLAGLQQWADYELLTGEALLAAHAGTSSVVGGMLEALGERAVPVFAAGAWPSGCTPADDMAELLRQLDEALAAAGPLDAVALNLHGATVAVGEPDVEARVAELLRSRVGEVPIAAVLDLHGNPSVELAAQVDAVIAYRTYPHVDMRECGLEAVALIDRMLGGERLATSIAKVPVLSCPLVQGTEHGVLGRLIGEGTARAAELGLARISVLAGFAYQDAERAGISVLVVAPVALRTEAEGLAGELADRVLTADDAGDFRLELPKADEAVTRARHSGRRPVVLADVADNIGAGSAGDGTVILREVLSSGATEALAVIADAEVVAQAWDAGEGAVIDVVLGGKTDALHGEPLPLRAEVVSLSDGVYVSEGSWAAGVRFEMGRTTVLGVAGNTVVVTERATPPFHREQVTSLGIDPARASIIVAKGALAWRAAYGDIAAVTIEVDAPGACPVDPGVLPRLTRPVTVLPPQTPRAGLPTRASASAPTPPSPRAEGEPA